MAINRYIGVPFTTDPRDIMNRCFAYLQAKIPGWTPAEGNLDVWLIEAFANEAADIATLTTEVPKSVYRYMGAVLFEIPPVDGAAATCTTTWHLADAVGHTISAGTQVGIRDISNNLVPFYVLTDVIVPNGSSDTGAGDVLLVAVTPGAVGSGLGAPGGPVELIDALAWVTSIEQVAATAGGADPESDDDYLDRLTIELRTLSPRPILAADFAILARNVAGVQRAVALDGYNPDDDTSGNERMVAVAALDEAGVPVAAGVKTAIEDYLTAMREINFVVKTLDATPVEIDVTAHYLLLPGYQDSDVTARITTVIQSYLSPAVWGMAPTDNPDDPITWRNDVIIYYLDLAKVIGDVVGVERITLLEIGLHGGALTSLDYDMAGAGKIPIPNPGTISVVAT